MEQVLNIIKNETLTYNQQILQLAGQAESTLNVLNIDDSDKCRITFNEITKTAVKSAVEHPRKVDNNLVDAQQARRVLDRLLGYQISPILWQKVRKGLSAGRVQSVATKIICDKEKEIEEVTKKKVLTKTN